MKERYLFRGKTISGEWVEGNLCQPKVGEYKDKTFISNSGGMPMAYEVIPEAIGQCTGLKDKNGKLIFEGDKVKDSEGTGIVCFGIHEYSFEVISGYWIEYKDNNGETHHHPLAEISEICEIIGNVHDKEKGRVC